MKADPNSRWCRRRYLRKRPRASGHGSHSRWRTRPRPHLLEAPQHNAVRYTATRLSEPMTVSLLLVALLSTYSGGQSRPSVTAESEVQSAVLDSFFVRPGIERLVIVDSTVRGADHFVDEDYASALRRLGTLPAGLREDFERKRAAATKLADLRTRVPVEIFTAEDRAALRSAQNPTEYWRRFDARFPRSSGLIAMSRVGFSADGEHALMLVDYGCGGLCGGTVYYLLTRQGSTWRTVQTVQPRFI